MTDISKAIKAINPTAEFSVNAEDYNQITWLNGTTPIAVDDIKTKQTELQTEYDALEYARKRKAAYPNIYDYMDGIVKDDQTQINKYIADSQAVKVRYPKG